MKLYGRLSALASDLSGHGIDYSPTNQQKEVYAILDGRLQVIEKKFQQYVDVEINKMNDQLKNEELKILLEKGGTR